MEEIYIQTLQNYIDAMPMFKTEIDSEEEFSRKSYASWITNELLEEFIKEYSESLPESVSGKIKLTPKQIISGMKAEIDAIASINGEKQFIFIVALEELEKIEDYFSERGIGNDY